MFNQALAAQPALLELAHEVVARGILIEQLQDELTKVRDEYQRVVAENARLSALVAETEDS